MKIQKPKPTRLSSPPPEVAQFLAQFTLSLDQDLSNINWTLSTQYKLDLYYFYDLLNHFDQILTSIDINHNIQLITNIINFSIILVNEGVNRSIYSLQDNLMKILDCDNYELIQRTLELLVRLYKISHKNINLNKINIFTSEYSDTFEYYHESKKISVLTEPTSIGDIPEEYKTKFKYIKNIKRIDINTHLNIKILAMCISDSTSDETVKVTILQHYANTQLIDSIYLLAQTTNTSFLVEHLSKFISLKSDNCVDLLLYLSQSTHGLQFLLQFIPQLVEIDQPKSLSLLYTVVFSSMNGLDLLLEADGVNKMINTLSFNPLTTKSKLKLLLHAIQADRVRGIAETSLLTQLKQLLDSGNLLYSTIINIVGTLIHNEPTLYQQIHDAQIPQKILSLELYPSSDYLSSIPFALGAFCLSSVGLTLVKESDVFTRFMAIFLSAEYMRLLIDDDLSSYLGHSFDELLRHHPVLVKVVYQSVYSILPSVSTEDSIDAVGRFIEGLLQSGQSNQFNLDVFVEFLARLKIDNPQVSYLYSRILRLLDEQIYPKLYNKLSVENLLLINILIDNNKVELSDEVIDKLIQLDEGLLVQLFKCQKDKKYLVGKLLKEKRYSVLSECCSSEEMEVVDVCLVLEELVRVKEEEGGSDNKEENESSTSHILKLLQLLTSEENSSHFNNRTLVANALSDLREWTNGEKLILSKILLNTSQSINDQRVADYALLILTSDNVQDIKQVVKDYPVVDRLSTDDELLLLGCLVQDGSVVINSGDKYLLLENVQPGRLFLLEQLSLNNSVCWTSEGLNSLILQLETTDKILFQSILRILVVIGWKYKIRPTVLTDALFKQLSFKGEPSLVSLVIRLLYIETGEYLKQLYRFHVSKLVKKIDLKQFLNQLVGYQIRDKEMFITVMEEVISVDNHVVNKKETTVENIQYSVDKIGTEMLQLLLDKVKSKDLFCVKLMTDYMYQYKGLEESLELDEVVKALLFDTTDKAIVQFLSNISLSRIFRCIDKKNLSQEQLLVLMEVFNLEMNREQSSVDDIRKLSEFITSQLSKLDVDCPGVDKVIKEALSCMKKVVRELGLKERVPVAVDDASDSSSSDESVSDMSGSENSDSMMSISDEEDIEDEQQFDDLSQHSDMRSEMDESSHSERSHDDDDGQNSISDSISDENSQHHEVVVEMDYSEESEQDIPIRQPIVLDNPSANHPLFGRIVDLFEQIFHVERDSRHQQRLNDVYMLIGRMFKVSVDVYEEVKKRCSKKQSPVHDDNEVPDAEEDEDALIMTEDISPTNAGDLDIHLTGIDPEFLEALPEDIRAEVILQHLQPQQDIPGHSSESEHSEVEPKEKTQPKRQLTKQQIHVLLKEDYLNTELVLMLAENIDCREDILSFLMNATPTGKYLEILLALVRKDRKLKRRRLISMLNWMDIVSDERMELLSECLVMVLSAIKKSGEAMDVD